MEGFSASDLLQTHMYALVEQLLAETFSHPHPAGQFKEVLGALLKYVSAFLWVWHVMLTHPTLLSVSGYNHLELGNESYYEAFDRARGMLLMFNHQNAALG